MIGQYIISSILQKEWIEAKGEEEVAKKELDAVKAKLANSEAALKANEPQFEELKKKHKEQEELLGMFIVHIMFATWYVYSAYYVCNLVCLQFILCLQLGMFIIHTIPAAWNVNSSYYACNLVCL